ncbi:hypothetical protein MFU01_74000 [Myxococcus fulvus]|uniref:Uncharacterized protein n=1 Tax=Myxococcus fulvus TaxID=33 RepID=A0A511TFD3_MYXFU|nr:hypothetical protein MFU01_74000 [Myxococcus fulvus]
MPQARADSYWEPFAGLDRVDPTGRSVESTGPDCGVAPHARPCAPNTPTQRTNAAMARVRIRDDNMVDLEGSRGRGGVSVVNGGQTGKLHFIELGRRFRPQRDDGPRERVSPRGPVGAVPLSPG